MDNNVLGIMDTAVGSSLVQPQLCPHIQIYPPLDYFGYGPDMNSVYTQWAWEFVRFLIFHFNPEHP